MQAMDDLRTVDAYLRGWSSRDADAILATLAAGATYEDPSTGGPIGGVALRAYMAGLWAAFPDLAFEVVSLAATGPGRAAAQWVMTGTNTGSMMGLPPTGRAVRLPGADFFSLEAGQIRTVTGYFDTASVPRQLGLDVIVQPRALGPFRFGTSVMVQTGATYEPGAFSVTYLEARDEATAQKVREDSRSAMLDMLKLPGFIGATTSKIGMRMVTVSAWDNPESPRRVMSEGAHARVMRGLPDGSLARFGYTSVWTKHRINPVFVRCESCGRMTRGPDAARRCVCGTSLPDPLPYW
jgi:steroid delta-isomerase-like uncharacterized protein